MRRGRIVATQDLILIAFGPVSAELDFSDFRGAKRLRDSRPDEPLRQLCDSSDDTTHLIAKLCQGPGIDAKCVAVYCRYWVPSAILSTCWLVLCSDRYAGDTDPSNTSAEIDAPTIMCPEPEPEARPAQDWVRAYHSVGAAQQVDPRGRMRI